MPWAISRVAAPCCSIASAASAAMVSMRCTTWAMPWIAATASVEVLRIACTWREISSVALAVWVASAFTSEATTAKPLPASPARAASMVAFSARRLVWPAMAVISFTTSPIFSAAPVRPCTIVSVRPASLTAWAAMLAEWRICSETAATVEVSSSAAAATLPVSSRARSALAPMPVVACCAVICASLSVVSVSRLVFASCARLCRRGVISASSTRLASARNAA